ncbi:hypothetical protein QTP88_017731 [Uroleucon formosanum]
MFITTKGGAAKEREKKRIKLNVAAKSCQNIQHFFMPINKINEHDIDDPTSVSNLIMCPAKFKPNLKVVTSSDNQVIESENTSQENDTTNLEVLTSSDAQVTVSSIDIHDPIHPSSLTHLNLKERILKGGYKPILSLYPRKLQGHKFRSFHKEWYKQYDWLEYSPTADAAFCFSCRMFKGNEKNSGQIDSTFFEKGFSAWYRAGEAFKKHQLSKYHLNSSTALYNYLHNTSIASKIDELHAYETSQKEIERQNNRITMNRLIDIVICLVKSGRPFRGHDESSHSVNQGLFKELVNLLSKYDTVLKKHLIEGPKHALYTMLVDSICEKSNSKGKQNRLIFNFLGTVQFIYNFIENSPMRHATLEKVAKETGDKLHTLKSCSNTRWACRAEAVKAIMNNYEVLIIAIENICENCPVPEMRAKGIGLLYQLKTFDFIFGMYMMNPILMLILKVSTLLQEPNLNLVLAMKNVNSLRSTLDSMRDDDSEYKQMFDRSVILCKKHDIAIPDSNSRKVSTRLDSNSSNQAFFNTKFDELKITVFYPLLDKLLSGIDLRFKQDTFDLVDAIACMLNMNLTQKTTKILSTFSKVSEDELITELKLLKNYENAMQLNGASSKSIYEWIDWLKTTGNSTVYTCVFKTLKMFTIIPVTSCTCERVFSKLTIVKNKLRSTMSQERLESLLLLFTEQEIVSKVDLNAVIDEFNSMGNRRMSL